MQDFPKSYSVTCNTLMLSDFERCLVYKDYSSLGAGTPEEIAERWDYIYAEYTERMEDEGAIRMIFQIAQVTRLEHTIQRVATLLGYMSDRYIPEIAAMLRDEFKFPLTATSYKQDCQKITAQLKTKAFERDKIIKDIEEYGKKTGGEKIDGTYFDVALIRYGTIMHYHVKKQEITTQQFCLMMKELREYIKANSK